MIRIMILAMDEKRGIGLSSSPSGLPWKIPSEMAYFKSMTTGNGVPGRYAVVMGYTTYLKILSLREQHPVSDLSSVRPLSMKGRDVYVLSYENVPLHHTVKSIDEIEGYDALFICGGRQVYLDSVAASKVDFALVSSVKGSYNCDMYMPEFEKNMSLLKTFAYEEFTVKSYIVNPLADTGFFNRLIAPL